MKKSLILVGMLCIGYANAQYDGKVGVNTEEPKATLDIIPEATNLTGTTNEGIIAPRLSKIRIANIAADKLTEGTLVYAIDDATSPISAYTGVDTKVSKITEKGYYFYNGTEWVKVQYKDTNDAEWVYDETTKRISLKRSGQSVGFVNKVYYDAQTGQRFDIFSDRVTFERANSDGTSTISSTPDTDITSVFKAKNMNYSKSSTLSLGADNNQHLFYNRLEVDKDATGQHHKIFENDLFVPSNNTNNYGTIYNTASITNLHGTGTVANSIGMWGQVNVANSQKITGYGTGLLGTVAISTSGKIGSMHGVYGRSFIGSAGAEVGELANLLLTSGHMVGDNTLIKAYTGIRNSIVSNSNNTARGNYIMGINNQVEHKGKTKYPNMYGIYTNSTITTGAIAPDNHYGVYVTAVTGGLNSNYAIYTNTGNVRFGDLKGTGNRNVYADADGVLRVGEVVSNGATTLTGEAKLECNETNRGKMNFVQDDSGFDIFGICMKGTKGYSWRYIYGNGGVSTGTGEFGTGLQ